MKKSIEKTIHIIIVISTFWAISTYFTGDPETSGLVRTECFNYFTTDSNVIAMIASALCLIFPNTRRPHWVSIFRFASVVAVSVTLFTVLFFLAPVAASEAGISGALAFFSNEVFVLHLTTPILSIIALMISEVEITGKEFLWAIVPVLIYSLVYLVLVVFIGIWDDWYGFTFGGNYKLAPLVLIIMYAFTAGLAFAEWKIQNRISHR